MYTRSFEMLFYTYSLIWLLIFLYIAYISYRSNRIEKKLKSYDLLDK